MRDKKYLDGEYLETKHWGLKERSMRFLEIMEEYSDKKDSILELGCSAGRNLLYLHDAGYENLTGLEMSRKAYDGIGDYCKKILGRFEENVRYMKKYDIIFSMSFFQEFPKDRSSENAVANLPSKVKKYLITIDYYDFQDILTKKMKLVREMGPKEPFSTPIKIYEPIN